MTDLEGKVFLKALDLYHEAKSEELKALASHLQGVTHFLFRQAAKPITDDAMLLQHINMYNIDPDVLKVYQDRAEMLYEEHARSR